MTLCKVNQLFLAFFPSFILVVGNFGNFLRNYKSSYVPWSSSIVPLKNWKSTLRPSHTFCLCQHSLCLVSSFLQNLFLMGMRSHIQPMYSPAASAPPTSTDQMSSTCALRVPSRTQWEHKDAPLTAVHNSSVCQCVVGGIIGYPRWQSLNLWSGHYFLSLKSRI